MADEPTAALDSHSGHTVIELLRHLAKEGGCTVLMVTHDPRIIDVADRVAHLEDGILRRSLVVTGV
jgi:putative ABC transport system ATP-binding protein